MYFRVRKSTRIKTGKPQPSSKVPITIEDSPSAQGKESPSKAPITYERGTPRSPTWKEKVELQDPKTILQEAQTVIQETLSRLQETQQPEKTLEEQPKWKEKATEPQEPDPQPNLASYYHLLEGGRIIPQTFAIPLFFELEKERIRTHRWMQIAKSKGVEDIGHMENKLRDGR